MISLVSLWVVLPLLLTVPESYAATAADYKAIPPFVTSGAPPLVMLVMGRDHKLYYEAYNDASDLNEDGILDIGYRGEGEPLVDSNSNGVWNTGESFTDINGDNKWTKGIEYYGYFDSYKCYTYSTADSRYEPSQKTINKKCSGTYEWSGDMLNYLTMSRMDTMRKVLYGGYRSTDSATETILQRVYVPQDGHTWGKEYTSIDVDGYDIADYTPFTAPDASAGLRHLFASTTLSADGAPLLRVALGNTHRIWQWVAKEAPVADDSIVTTAGGHPGHPQNHDQFEAMVNSYANAAYLFGSYSWLDYNIRNHVDEKYPSPSATAFGAIDGYGNPWGSDYKGPHKYNAPDQENYLAVFTGTLNVMTAGDYQVAVDGDDAVEVIIDGGTADEQIIGFYGYHGWCQCTTHSRTISLSAGPHTVEFRMEEAGGADRYHLYWNGLDSDNEWVIIPAAAFTDLTLSTYKLSTPASFITNYEVRVKVCDPSVGLESNCKQYPDGNYKPIGLLQRHGENQNMYFGLLTGSYAKNTSGGVLRKQVGDISDEIIGNTGQFGTSTNGIIQTINKLRIFGYDYVARSYNQNCGWITSGPMTEGQCRDWGNPVAEMMYETLRYFAGKKTLTSLFDYSGTTDDSSLGLPKPSWNDPYDMDDNGFDRCSKAFMLVLSDINPSYDSDNLTGVDANFGVGITGDLTGLNVSTLADTMSTAEGISSTATRKIYIGQSGAAFDGSCTAKDISGFGDIRGLCPEEPTKGGGYYSALVAYYGHTTDLQSTVDDDQNVTTYSVALASPLPRIDLKVGGMPVTLVPFAKTIGSNGNSRVWNYWPTNTIVDFFITTLTPTSGTFLINYEDVEQGADHDMDNIVSYTYQLVDSDGNTVTDPADSVAVDITLATTYASSSYIQHSGYIISGTTKDGSYLEVTDKDTNPAADFLVFLDTPPGTDPIFSADDVTPNRDKHGETHNAVLGTLPYSTTRRFYPALSGGATVAAQLLENPLWYAAKWGAFEDKDNDGTPNNSDGTDSEWDKDNDGVPDTYFYVTNPLRLEEQLNKSFASILNQASSGTAASVISNSRSGEGSIIQSVFYPEKIDTTANANSVTWVGQVHAVLVDAYGNMREDNGNKKLDPTNIDPIILFNDDGTIRRFIDSNQNQLLDPSEKTAGDTAANDVNIDQFGFLWNAKDRLSAITDTNVVTQRSVSTSSNYLANADNYRYIFTWIDTDSDGVVESSEVTDFAWPSTSPPSTVSDLSTGIYPYLHLYPSFGDKPQAVTDLSTTDFATFLLSQTERQINYIRGLDDIDASGNPNPLTISGSDVAGTEMRARKFEGETWRLGDIVHSTPTLVGRPAEAFHLLYRDTSYAAFAAQYHNRRSVVYVGANDGMVHAFNAGFYHAATNAFCQEINSDYDPNDTLNVEACLENKSTTTMPELGTELWGYVPYNLLPHLYWLTQTTYDENQHVYYVDQKPIIFDAKIFFLADGITELDTDHPNGWGTVMVIGMRFGGSSIVADMDKTDGDSPDTDTTDGDGVDPTMKSAFMIFDITNPEIPPRLLAELTMPNMGFSTSFPAVAVMKDGDHDKAFEDYNTTIPELGENRWFLAFGSGPADSSGNPGSVDATTGAYDNSILVNAKSSQHARFYMLDLVQLASNNGFWTLDDSGELTAGLHSYVTLDPNSFVSASITVDYDLDYNADVLYFGTVSDETGVSTTPDWGGKLRRIVIDDVNDTDEDQNPVNWVADNVLIDAGQPITAASAVGQDDYERHWVYFGTGRYFVDDDRSDLSMQSYYGIKEPVNFKKNDGTTATYDDDGYGDTAEVTVTDVISCKQSSDCQLVKTWATVPAPGPGPPPYTSSRSGGNLLNVTDYQVFTGETVSADGTTTVTWDTFEESQDIAKDGWYLDFFFTESDDSLSLKGERNLGQASLIGGLLSFTTFIPPDDICEAGGKSDLWALYYKTGTAYFTGVLGTTDGSLGGVTRTDRAKRSIGDETNWGYIKGLATSPNIHVGREEGSVVYVQSSTGEIIRIEQKNPLSTKSGVLSWKLR
jgi:type IV pilus assembly protein PilY1